MPITRVRHGWRLLRKIKRDLKHRVLGVPWMEVRESDRFLFSWPRSGNTWVRHILYHYVQQTDVDDMESLDFFSPTIDTLEFNEQIKKMPKGMRFFKSHLPFSEYFLIGKVVYIVRDGRDSIISNYDYYRHIKKFRGDLAGFLETSLTRWMRYGSWHANVGSWVAHRDHPNMLLVRYEDMMANPVDEVERILAFCELPVDRERIRHAVAASTVDKVNSTFQSWTAAKGSGFAGGLGGGQKWRRHLSPEQNARFLEFSRPLIETLGYETD